MDWCKPVCVQRSIGFGQLPDLGVEERRGGTDFALSAYRQLIRGATRSEAGSFGGWSLRHLLLCSPFPRGLASLFFTAPFVALPGHHQPSVAALALFFPLGTTFPRVPTLKGLKCCKGSAELPLRHNKNKKYWK